MALERAMKVGDRGKDIWWLVKKTHLPLITHVG